MLPTSTKVQIAKAINRIIVGARTTLGYEQTTRVRRSRLNWSLDLNEGIDLAIYLGVYQKAPIRVLNRWAPPGSVVMDIGANIGAFALPLATHVGPSGKVIALEPTNFAFAKLQTNIRLNNELVDRIIPMQVALQDSTANARTSNFYSSWPLRTETSSDIHAKHSGRLEEATDIRFLTLDGLLAELRASGQVRGPVAFVKLDVDGNELSVLRGGSGLLQGDRPTFLVEIAPHVQDEVPGRFEDLVSTFSNHQYGFESASSGSALPMNAGVLRTIIPAGASLDIVARPN
jgi:FkbM family methyltransferase